MTNEQAHHLPPISTEALAAFGGGKIAYVKPISLDDVKRMFPQAPQRFTPGAVRILSQYRRADCSKARNELGYQPTSLVEAVREAYEFFVSQGKIAPRTSVVVRGRGRQREAHGA